MIELDAARASQLEWASLPSATRARLFRNLRHRIAELAETFAAAAERPGMGIANVLVSEVMPLLAACKFLERHSAAILRNRTLGWRDRPLWLLGIRSEVRRVPFGVVLVIGPSNYPLFLPGVQALQALAAGNAVAVKPAPGCSRPMQLLQATLVESGFPTALFALLGDSTAEGAAALRAGVDKVLVTGSVETGRKVLATLAATVTPAAMELSGRDPLIVLPGADPAVVARALAYGLRLNGGATCIAPRRVLVVGPAEALLSHLATELRDLPTVELPTRVIERVTVICARSRERGDFVIGEPPQDHRMAPLVISSPHPLDWENEDIFAPLASLRALPNVDSAIRLANAGPYALGASVFGPPAAARACGDHLRAGSIVINDLIVPTADPRLPFGGAGLSGFGSTRGVEGLLECTSPVSYSVRRRPSVRHLALLPDSAAPHVAAMLHLAYGGLGRRRALHRVFSNRPWV